MNLPWFLMRVHWPTTMQDFRGLQGDKSKFWVGFLRGYSKNYPLRHIQTGSFPYSSDGKYRLSIMMHGLLTQSLSKYYDLSNQRNDIFTCGENVLSNHKEPVRSTGFSMRETPYLFTKFIMRKDQTQCWPPGPFPILVSTV